MPADPGGAAEISRTARGSRTAAGTGPLVRVRSVAKRFGPVAALTGIDLDFHAGTIHALVGENGAGKSTLGRVLSGAVQPDTGQVLLSGRPVRLSSPRAALRAGVAAISQEVTLVPTLPVLDNVFLGTEEQRLGVLAPRQARSRYRHLLAQAGFDLPADARVGDLGVADQQKVEILRAIARDARVLIMDEPTAALVSAEVRQLMQLIRDLAAAGKAVIYIAHALDEVLALAHTITVMRDGRIVRTAAASTETAAGLATAMLGRPVDLEFPPRARPPDRVPIACQVNGLAKGNQFRDVTFTVREGEILGLAGLAGSGCIEVAQVLGGASRPRSGQILLGQKKVRLHSPAEARAQGVSLLPESRREQGLFLNRPVRENVSAGWERTIARLGWVSRRQERARVNEVLATFDVRMSSPDAKVSTLSGGNQQKVLLARCAFIHPKMLVAVQPTRGVDVGARSAIYRLLAALAADGLAIVLVSAEMEEVYGLSHRILVFRRGRITAELSPPEASYSDLMGHVLGADPGAPAGVS